MAFHDIDLDTPSWMTPSQEGDFLRSHGFGRANHFGGTNVGIDESYYTPKQVAAFDALIHGMPRSAPAPEGPRSVGGALDTMPAGGGENSPGPTPGEISGITGYSPGLVGLGLGALGAVPGSPMGIPSAAFSAANMFGLAGQDNLTDENGNPVSYTGPHSLPGMLGRALGMLEGPAMPQFTDSQGNPIVPDRTGETGAMGLGAQAAYDAVQAGKSPFTDGPQTGQPGQPGDTTDGKAFTEGMTPEGLAGLAAQRSGERADLGKDQGEREDTGLNAVPGKPDPTVAPPATPPAPPAAVAEADEGDEGDDGDDGDDGDGDGTGDGDGDGGTGDGGAGDYHRGGVVRRGAARPMTRAQRVASFEKNFAGRAV